MRLGFRRGFFTDGVFHHNSSSSSSNKSNVLLQLLNAAQWEEE